MASAKVFRLSGISLLLGCVIIVIATLPGVFLNDDPASAYNVYSSFIRVIGGMLLVLGFPGVYARQSQRAGILGLIGFCLTVIYILVLGAFGDAFDAFAVPFIATHAPALMQSEPPALNAYFLVGGLFGVVGGVLFGIATLRASLFSRWAAILLIVGSLAQFLGDMFNLPIANPGLLLFMIGLAWLGWNVAFPRTALVDTSAEIPGGAVRS